jgi:hypothetical protein
MLDWFLKRREKIMKKNSIEVPVDFVSDLVNPAIFCDWIAFGSKKGWLKAEEEKIFLERKYSDSIFAVTISRDGKTVLCVKKTPETELFRLAKTIFYDEVDGDPKVGLFIDLKGIGLNKNAFIYFDALKDFKDLLDLSDIVFLANFEVKTGRDIKIGKVLAKIPVIKKE